MLSTPMLFDLLKMKAITLAALNKNLARYQYHQEGRKHTCMLMRTWYVGFCNVIALDKFSADNQRLVSQPSPNDVKNHRGLSES